MIGLGVGFFLLPACIQYDTHKPLSGVIINRMCIVTNLFLFCFACLLESNMRHKIYSASVNFLYPVPLKSVIALSSAPSRLSCPSFQ